MAGAHPAGSWMAPGAAKLDLLYVSDYATNDVYAYSYPQGKLSGVLEGILKESPLQAALCADAKGDVFVPNSSNSTLLEYAHGSTKLVATLQDPDELPYGCAVDPRTGDLAVVNYESYIGPGGLAVYAHANGLPRIYVYGFAYKFYFDAYDAQGNLFVDAVQDEPSEPFALLELPEGSHSLKLMSLDETFSVPAGVAWDGKYVDVGDSQTSVVYRFAIAGLVGTKVGATPLGAGRDVEQFLVDGNRLVGANFHGGSVAFWEYPAGGAPTEKLRGFGRPFGVALSEAPK